MIHDASLDELLQKVWDGGRISPAEALRLFRLPLAELGALADRRRQLAKASDYDGRGSDIVTYIVDRNVNYTNVCNVYCKFCAFYRTEKDADAYVISHEEMDRKIEETVALGGTQILLQGGHHPKLTKQWYLDLLSHMKAKFPQVNIHGFSPSEFVAFQEFFGEPVEQILRDFVKAGLGSIPGGGGEILVDRVRQRIAPLKAMTDEWMGVMDTAHRLGLASTATMMFGHVETVEERIEHLEVVRRQQDKSLERAAGTPSTLSEGGANPPDKCALCAPEPPMERRAPARLAQPKSVRAEQGLGAPVPGQGRGEDGCWHPDGPFPQTSRHSSVAGRGSNRLGGAFTAFIAWTFQAGHTMLKAPTVGAHEYLRTQALSRLYLDNIPNIQSSWVTQGQEIGQVALKYGANDLGSIMIEENVVRQAGATFRMGVADMQRLILELGYEPRQRDNWYRLIR